MKKFAKNISVLNSKLISENPQLLKPPTQHFKSQFKEEEKL